MRKSGVLFSPAFTRLTLYRGCITLAYQILTVTAGWHIYSLTHDVVALGLIGLAEVIPYFLLSLFAGHAVDVLPKKLIALIGCACYVAISTLMVVMVTDAGTLLPLTMWIYVAMGLAGAARSLLRPAYSAIMVRILEREHLARATAISTVVFQIALVSGPVIGGLLIAWQDVRLAYLATGVFALTGVVAMLGLKVIETPRTETATSVFASIREGLRFVSSTQVMLAAMALDMFAVLFGGVSVVLRQTILQLVTPQHMQGRVTAINGLFIGSSNEIGALESGIAANLLGLVPSILFGGSMTLLVVGFAWLLAPQLRALHMRDLHRAIS